MNIRSVCATGSPGGVHLEDEVLLESLHLHSCQCRHFRSINLVGHCGEGKFFFSDVGEINTFFVQVSGAPNRRVMNFTRHLILLFVILLLASHQKPIIDKEMEVNNKNPKVFISKLPVSPPRTSGSSTTLTQST